MFRGKTYSRDRQDGVREEHGYARLDQARGCQEHSKTCGSSRFGNVREPPGIRVESGAAQGRGPETEKGGVDVIDYRKKWEQAAPFAHWVDKAEKNAELWRGLARRATVSDDAVREVSSLDGSWKLLVLSEDWCSDAVSTLPFVARLAESSPNIEMRVLARDDHMDVMLEHRTPRPAVGTEPSGWSNAIPVVIVLDGDFEERGWWGPRPAELQRWFWTEGQSLTTKQERGRYLRTWYARDRGVTTTQEILGLLNTITDGGHDGRRVA